MAGSDALALALALHEDPSLRRVLRQRPLPAGMTALLEAATGRACATAEQLGIDGVTARDAARFFVQQILMAEDGDAYRILGLDRGASDASVKQHYRLLQHWLHPDRGPMRVDYADAARRVNTAWNRLRNPERRQRYDQDPGRSTTAWPGAVAVPHWQRVEAIGPVRHGRPLATMIPLLALATLLGLWRWLPPAQRGAEQAQIVTVADPHAWHIGSGIDSGIGRASDAHEHAKAPSRSQPVPSRAGQPGHARPLQSRAAGNADRGPAKAAEGGLRGAFVAPVRAPDEAPVPERKETSAVAPHPALASPSNAVAVASLDAGEQMRRAEAVRMRQFQLQSYLLRPGATPPPVWRGAPALDAAERIKSALGDGARKAELRQGIAKTEWVIGEDHASAMIPLGDAPGATASIRVDWQWRDGEWWVERMRMETLR